MSDSVGVSPSDHEAVPPQVPDLDLIRCIGRGGFGEVWLATNRATGHLRAVKVISLGRSETTDPAGREITSITRLEENVRTQHPNLLNIHHVGKTADHLFYIMDPADDVSGAKASSDSSYQPATLQSRLQGGPLSPQESLRFARQLLAGLASLHAAGMVHRDVKPANCLFVAGQLKLADFGLLAEADPQTSCLGTLRYMPPDGRMDARADVYAAGLVIYEMLTGLPAEGFPRLGARVHQIVGGPVLCGLNQIVLRACHPHPQRRFQDAREMLAGLIVPDPETPTRWARRWGRVVRWLAYLAVMGAVAAVVLWPDRPQVVYRQVHVNFISVPFEATILLDGTPAVDEDGNPYTTPCTVPQLPARVHRVEFRHDELDDLEAGQADFAEVREVVAEWGSESEATQHTFSPP